MSYNNKIWSKRVQSNVCCPRPTSLQKFTKIHPKLLWMILLTKRQTKKLRRIYNLQAQVKLCLGAPLGDACCFCEHFRTLLNLQLTLRYFSQAGHSKPRSAPTLTLVVARWGLIPTTSGSCLCHEHTTNLATGVSRLPVLDCGTTFHPGFDGRDFRSTLLDDLWRHISLATEAPSDFFEL